MVAAFAARNKRRGRRAFVSKKTADLAVSSRPAGIRSLHFNFTIGD